MTQAIADFIAEYLQVVIFLVGLVYAHGRSVSRHNCFEKSTEDKFKEVKFHIHTELKHSKEYVDIKTTHMNAQIEDIKKSIDNMTSSIETLCDRVYKIIDKKGKL